MTSGTKQALFCSVAYMALSTYGITAQALTQDQTSDNKQVPAVRMLTTPKIDGVFSAGEWDGASVITDFHQYKPVDQGTPNQKTTVYVSYDDDFLYVAGYMHDTDPSKIVANQKVQGDRTYSDDSLKLYLSPYNNQRSGYYFRVNLNDVRMEALMTSSAGHGAFNTNWSGIWYAKSTRVDDGWTTELAIPFKTLNFNPNNEVWGFGVGRDIGRDGENIGWTSYNRDIRPDSLGELMGLRGAKQGMGLDINASLSSGYVKDYDTGETTFEVKPSVDVFYKITPQMTAIITANTDFSATDVDDQVVNLSRFSVFLPEKRRFFLQDADIFNFGGIRRNGTPFFSRRIGLDEDSVPVDMKVGVKLTGRIGNWNLGVLDVLQGRGDHMGDANLFVGRASYNLFENSSIGAIMTYGDPITNAGSYLIGSDVKLRSRNIVKGKQLEFNGWVQKSHNPGVVGDDKAFGGSLNVSSSQGYSLRANYTHIEDNFDPSLGFVNRSNINDYGAGLDYKWLVKNSFIREIQTGVSFDEVSTIGGSLENRDKNLKIIGMSTHSGERLDLNLHQTRDIFSDDFEIVDGVIIPGGDYSWTNFGAHFSTSSRRFVWARLNYNTGKYYTGDKKSVGISLNFRPKNGIVVGGSFNQNSITLPNGAFKTKIASLNTTVAINSEWSLNSKLQYDNVSDSGGVNAKLRYNPAPGKDLYVVVNYGFYYDDFDKFHTSTFASVVKAGYTFRF